MTEETGMSADPKRLAAKNMRDSVATSRQFPENVFHGQWDEFLFFDSDRMFDAEFADIVRSITCAEEAHCACISNLDETPVDLERLSIFLDDANVGESYVAMLRRAGSPPGWLSTPERYGCTSDLGSWCMYCERMNEIAVIALRGERGRFGKDLQRLVARPIDESIENPSCYGLSSLSPTWVDQLLLGYSKRTS